MNVEELRKELKKYIDSNYVELRVRNSKPMLLFGSASVMCKSSAADSVASVAEEVVEAECSSVGDFIEDSYEENAFAKALNLYMYERDITTAMIYERCFVDRKLISKITAGSNYHPSKNTVLSLCIGLRLNVKEAKEFLELAGFSFSNGSRYDLIIKYMLIKGIYDLDVINDMLYDYGEPCIGA